VQKWKNISQIERNKQNIPILFKFLIQIYSVHSKYQTKITIHNITLTKTLNRINIAIAGSCERLLGRQVEQPPVVFMNFGIKFSAESSHIVVLPPN